MISEKWTWESFANWHSLFKADNSFLIRSAPIVSHQGKYCSEVILLVTDGKSKLASKCTRKQWVCQVSSFSSNTLANKLLFLSEAKWNSEHLYGRTQSGDLSVSKTTKIGGNGPLVSSVKSWAKCLVTRLSKGVAGSSSVPIRGETQSDHVY